MNPEINAKILKMNGKGLSEYYISKELHITPWQARMVIVEEIKNNE